MSVSGPPLGEGDFVPLHQLLAKGLAADADDWAFVSPLTRKSWAELDAESDHYARQLLAKGLKPGDRVASLMPNRYALLVHYLACFKAGLVAVPLNYRYMAPEIDHALGLTDASILLAHAERDDDLAKSELAPRLPLGTITYDASDGREGTFEQLMVAPAEEIELTPPQPDDDCIIFFTSGSTGKPKGVTHSNRSYGFVLASIVQGFEITSDDIVLPGSSLSHLGGNAFALAALAAGGKVVTARAFDGDELLPLLRIHRPTLLWMLPAALFVLERDHHATRDDFRSVRLCTAGGDKVSAALEKEFTELTGFPIDELYGMSEFGLATVSPVSGDFRLGSVGTALPGFELSVRDEDGVELPVNEPGRLWVRAPSNMMRYWAAPEATAETIVDGWLDTGDVMRMDEDGYLWFGGRKKQIIVHDGSNVAPQDVEEAIAEHPAIESVGVVGVHNLLHGENVRAYVTVRDGVERPKAQDVIQFARERVGYKAPEDIFFLDEMPLNATGKVDRVTLKKWSDEEHAELHAQEMQQMGES